LLRARFADLRLLAFNSLAVLDNVLLLADQLRDLRRGLRQLFGLFLKLVGPLGGLLQVLLLLNDLAWSMSFRIAASRAAS
jgi:hypothetical protein